jgi:hypothetical protein
MISLDAHHDQPSRFLTRTPITGLLPRTFSTFPEEKPKIPTFLNGRTSWIGWLFAMAFSKKKPSSIKQCNSYDLFRCASTLAFLDAHSNNWPFATHVFNILLRKTKNPHFFERAHVLHWVILCNGFKQNQAIIY